MSTPNKSSVVAQLTEKKLALPPKWLPGSVAYETIMGSMAYGVSSDSSDMDVYGFCIPPKNMVFPHLAGEIMGFGRQHERFDQFQQHHIKDADALGGTGRDYDLTIFSIVKYFSLLMENNPNVLDSIFTPVTCVLHSTRIGEMVRDRRRDFLHKGSWHKFKGYAYSQLHKMDIKTPQPGSKRAADIEKFGFDCYDEQETEFLTQRGFLRFDAVTETDYLASVDPETGRIVFAPFLRRVDNLYSGKLYTIEPYLSRCVVTEGHQMLVSPMYRNTANNFSTQYDAARARWQLLPLCQLLGGRRGSRTARSFFHIRRQGVCETADYPISDAYLKLAGLYISEGCIQFRNNEVKAAAFTQTDKGKQEFHDAANALMDTFPIRRHAYEKEIVWAVHGEVARQLHKDFSYLSKHKHLPDWCFQLSVRQAELLWGNMCLGDGTVAPNGEVYYTASPQLAKDLQSMLTLCGLLCSVRGPYNFATSYGLCPMYQIFRSRTATPEHYVNFGRVQTNETEPSKGRVGWPVKMREVSDRRVVCFTVPSGTLITRSGGKTALHGNCKFAYHVVRLIDEAEQILTTGDIDLQRSREVLKAIRRGEWTAEQVREFFNQKEKALEAAYDNSKLPHSPDEAKIKALLLECLEAHYGSLTDAVVVVGHERDLLKQIKDLCEKAGV